MSCIVRYRAPTFWLAAALPARLGMGPSSATSMDGRHGIPCPQARIIIPMFFLLTASFLNWQSMQSRFSLHSFQGSCLPCAPLLVLALVLVLLLLAHSTSAPAKQPDPVLVLVVGLLPLTCSPGLALPPAARALGARIQSPSSQSALPMPTRHPYGQPFFTIPPLLATRRDMPSHAMPCHAMPWPSGASQSAFYCASSRRHLAATRFAWCNAKNTTPLELHWTCRHADTQTRTLGQVTTRPHEASQ